MKNIFRTEWALALGLVCGSGCASTGGPSPFELDPLDESREAPPPLPDDLERASAQLAALVLAEQQDAAAETLGMIHRAEQQRRAQGKAPSGLTDNAQELVNALGGSAAYRASGERLLADDSTDPRLRRRIEHHRDSAPLSIAQARLSEDQRRKLGSIVNRLSAPVSQFAMGNSLGAVEIGRAAVGALIVMHSIPTTSIQERQALRAYEDFLVRNPDSPEAPRVRARVEKYRRELKAQQYTEATAIAERSLSAGRPDAALLHLARARRINPEGARAWELEAKARVAQAHRRAAIQSSLAADTADLPSSSPFQEGFRRRVLVATLTQPLPDVALLATQWENAGSPPQFADEIDFLQALGHLGGGREYAFFDAMRDVGEPPGPAGNMARHARWVVVDPDQNLYAAFQRAKSADVRARTSWLLLGSLADGPTKLGLPRPVEWVLSVPAYAGKIVSLPGRLLQYPEAQARFGGAVIYTGERYLSRRPNGEHAEEVRGELESRYRARGQWSQALAHHQERNSRDPEAEKEYRELIARRTLEAARSQRRRDVRLTIYRSVLDEYPGTETAETARREIRQLIEHSTPQNIRVSREFLREHPEVAGPGGLGLRPELLDDETRNGELAEEGVTLLGRTLVRIPLEGGEVTTKEIPPERFGRFVALLEEASYQNLVSDRRERFEPDPKRDQFFERARLGVVDVADLRPSASSDAEFLGSTEKHGTLRRAESILPVELVLQGGLEDFGFAAFPRVKLPGETPDAILYK